MVKKTLATTTLLALGVGLAGAQQDSLETLKSYQEVEAFFQGKTSSARIKTGEGDYVITRVGGKVIMQTVVDELTEDEARARLLLQYEVPARVPRLHSKAELQAFVEGAGPPTAVYCHFQDNPDSIWTKKGDELVVAYRGRKTVTVPKAEWEDVFLQDVSTLCCRNLKTTGIALELYSSDFRGHFPADLRQLTPGYLKTIPTCPASREGYRFQVRSQPDNYTLFCGGHHHGKYHAADYPRYGAFTGLKQYP